MGDIRIGGQFHHLRIHHNKFDVIGIRLINNTHDQRIDTHRFTRAGRPCHEHMGHFGNICDNSLAANVLSHSKGQIGLGALKFPALQQFTKSHHIPFGIRHLDAHCRLAGDRRLDPYIRSRQAQLDIIRKSGDAADFYSLLRHQLIPGDARSAAHISHLHLDAKTFQCSLKFGCCIDQVLIAETFIPRLGLGEKIQRRNYIRIFLLEFWFLDLFLDLLNLRLMILHF